jgi:hypothetical protein
VDATREADLFAKRGGTEIATLPARCATFDDMRAASAETGRLPRWFFYVLIAAAAAGPLVLGWSSGDYDMVRRLAETPVVVGLVAFVVKMLLDANERVQDRAEDRHREDREDAQRRHEAERAVLTQQLEHAFAVGSSSHMANVAFDKHVKFCEDYAEELRRTIGTLIAHVTTAKALDHAAALTLLRQNVVHRAERAVSFRVSGTLALTPHDRSSSGKPSRSDSRSRLGVAGVTAAA